MYKKVLLNLFCFLIVSLLNGYCADLTIGLNFPQKSTAKFSAPKAIEPPIEISGNLILDITPYPMAIESSRYSVEYYLEGQLIYETDGFNEARPENLSFRYVLDTTKFPNGTYKIIVNFWDNKSESAVGIKEVLIKNKQ